MDVFFAFWASFPLPTFDEEVVFLPLSIPIVYPFMKNLFSKYILIRIK